MLNDQLRPAVRTNSGRRSTHLDGFDPYARLCSAMLIKCFKDYSRIYARFEVEKDRNQIEKLRVERNEIRKFLRDPQNPFVLYLSAKGHELGDNFERVLKEIELGSNDGAGRYECD